VVAVAAPMAVAVEQVGFLLLLGLLFLLALLIQLQLVEVEPVALELEPQVHLELIPHLEH
jgi:hypothetical protein